MATRPYTVFDGYSMTLYNADGTVVGSWAAISGVRGHQKPSEQFTTNVGPLPEGHYSFSLGNIEALDSVNEVLGLVGRGGWPGGMAAWGTERAFLTPDFDTHGRSGFSIHRFYPSQRWLLLWGAYIVKKYEPKDDPAQK